MSDSEYGPGFPTASRRASRRVPCAAACQPCTRAMRACPPRQNQGPTRICRAISHVTYQPGSTIDLRAPVSITATHGGDTPRKHNLRVVFLPLLVVYPFSPYCFVPESISMCAPSPIPPPPPPPRLLSPRRSKHSHGSSSSLFSKYLFP